MQVTFGASNDIGGKWLCCKNVYSAFNGPDLLPCQVGKGQEEREMGENKSPLVHFSVMFEMGCLCFCFQLVRFSLKNSN